MDVVAFAMVALLGRVLVTSAQNPGIFRKLMSSNNSGSIAITISYIIIKGEVSTG